MSDFIYKKGVKILWKIENYESIVDGQKITSPKFFIETSKKTTWSLDLRMNKGFFSNPYLHCGLKNDNYNQSFIIESSVSNSNSDDLPVYWSHQIKSFSVFSQTIHCFEKKETKNISTKDILTIHCYLRDISSVDSVMHSLTFYTFIETEYRNLKFILPNIKYFSLDTEELLFPLQSLSEKSTVFEMRVKKIENKELKIIICNATKDNSENLSIQCKLSIESTNNEVIQSAYHSHEFLPRKENIWNFPVSFDYNAFEKYLKSAEDILFLKCELLISEHKHRTWTKEYILNPYSPNQDIKDKNRFVDKEKANLRDDLMCLYVERKFTDVEIVVGNKTFPVHKSILSARSPVFSAMFNNDMLEKEKNKVEISDLDAETVDRMLFFMYSEILRDQYWNNVVKLFSASDKYQIITLKDKCSEIMRQKLTVENACEALMLSDRHHDMELQCSVQNYIAKNSKKVFYSDEWKKFMNEEPKLACYTMHKAYLNIN